MALPDDGLEKLTEMEASIKAGRSIYLAGYRATERETLHDFRIAAELMAQRIRQGDVTNVRLLITYDVAP
jgi:hypothetical protein